MAKEVINDEKRKRNDEKRKKNVRNDEKRKRNVRNHKNSKRQNPCDLSSSSVARIFCVNPETPL